MRSTSTLPQELYRSRPRPVRLSGAGRALAVTAVLLCLAAPVIAVLLHRETVTDSANRSALLRRALIVNGAVARVHRDSKNSKRSTVGYQFRVNGEVFENEAKLPSDRARAFKVGSPLPIRYLAENPDVNIPDGVLYSVPPVALGYILAPLPLGLGLAFWLVLRYQRRLLTDGRAAMAVITSVTTSRGQHGESIRHVHYEFQLLSGVAHSGAVQTREKVPEVGSSVAVLYDDERPYRNRPYPLSLVRVVDSDS
jgi:hypothetical protein